MKSIILSFLLFSTTLSLFPFVAFSRSSTTFISDNPIFLPTTTHNNNDVPPPVLDLDGEPLQTDEEYMIQSIPFGGGQVYLADLGSNKCPNEVAQDSSGDFIPGTPVKFFTFKYGSKLVLENEDVSIMFSNSTCEVCANETVWKVGEYFIAPNPPPRFVVTGGILGKPGPENLKNWFKIEKFLTQKPNSYKFRYCPSQYMCPECIFYCADIGLTFNSGVNRLALNDEPYPFGFAKIKKNAA